MKTINLSEEPSIAQVYLAAMRNVDQQTDRLKFRFNLKRLGQLMAYEVSKNLEYLPKDIQTPLAKTQVHVLANQPYIIAIMRAALPFYEGVLSVFDEADSGFIGAYRTTDFRTSKTIRTEYIASGDILGKTVILVDPMLATGKSMLDAITKLKEFGEPKKWVILSAIAAPEGVDFLNENCTDDVELWCGSIDSNLNDKYYIVPGLGDAGDLAYGEKNS